MDLDELGVGAPGLLEEVANVSDSLRHIIYLNLTAGVE